MMEGARRQVDRAHRPRAPSDAGTRGRPRDAHAPARGGRGADGGGDARGRTSCWRSPRSRACRRNFPPLRDV